MVVVANEALDFEGDVLAPGKVSCFHFVGLLGKRFMSFAADGGVGGGGKGSASGLSLFWGCGGEVPEAARGGAAEEAFSSIVAAIAWYIVCKIYRGSVE